jgi:hypothetical protein
MTFLLFTGQSGISGEVERMAPQVRLLCVCLSACPSLSLSGFSFSFLCDWAADFVWASVSPLPAEHYQVKRHAHLLLSPCTLSIEPLLLLLVLAIGLRPSISASAMVLAR